MKKNAERWMELCELAAKEPDPNRLISLTNEIVRLLDEKRNPTNIGKSPQDSESNLVS